MRVILDHDRAVLFHGDSSELALPDNSIDSIVCDPPAAIGFMGRGWDGDKGGFDQWTDWLATILVPAFRALKPGGYGLIWALPRTSHWTAVALEKAGFEIRDRVSAIFGSGFPKALNLSKAVDAHFGATPIDLGRPKTAGNGRPMSVASEDARAASAGASQSGATSHANATAPSTEEAKAWEGWATALKPAMEDWWLVQKPREGTYAENLLKWGVGGLNIDGCRLDDRERTDYGLANSTRTQGFATGAPSESADFDATKGRWPSHLLLGDAEAAAALDAQAGPRKSGARKAGTRQGRREGQTYGDQTGDGGPELAGSEGGVSRFFYCPKPAKKETELGLDHLPKRTAGEATDREDGSDGLKSPRAGAGRTGGARNVHPTKKAKALMSYLCRMITPPGGVVLDPFAGSGSTGVAALAEGFSFIGCELGGDDEDPQKYLPVLVGRIRHALGLEPEAVEVTCPPASLESDAA